MEERKLLIDHATRSSSVFLIILGGQMTIVNAFLKGSPDLWLAFLAMFLMLMASLGVLAVAEQNVREVNPAPNFKYQFLNKFFGSFLPTSTESQHIYSSLSAFCFLVSMLLFGWVVFKSIV